jgi:hypothetical protein
VLDPIEAALSNELVAELDDARDPFALDGNSFSHETPTILVLYTVHLFSCSFGAIHFALFLKKYKHHKKLRRAEMKRSKFYTYKALHFMFHRQHWSAQQPRRRVVRIVGGAWGDDTARQ